MKITRLFFLYVVLISTPGLLRAQGLPVSQTTAAYWDQVQGATPIDLVRHGLASNGDLAAARLEVERARARVLQAGLKPNPTIDFEHEPEKDYRYRSRPRHNHWDRFAH